MATIGAGTYSIGEIFQQAAFDFPTAAAADYLNGAPDYRRVQIGGLGFDSLDQKMVIPVTADSLEITVDGEILDTLTITLTPEQEAERAFSFSVAADATDPLSLKTQLKSS